MPLSYGNPLKIEKSTIVYKRKVKFT